MDAVHFTSAKTGTGSDVWTTPRWLFDFLDKEFGPFDLDAAASAENALCTDFYDEVSDGLFHIWGGKVWCNPPYSDLGKWLKKGHDAVHVERTAERVVMLIPARTDTKAFQAYAPNAVVFFLKGRLKFGGVKKWSDHWNAFVEVQNSAPFPSAVIVFDRMLEPTVLFVDWKAP